MKGYKGFNKDMKCNGFQFECGKEYTEPEAAMCEKGFHFCEHPLDVWNYYPPCDGNKFAEVEGDGDIKKTKEDENTKVCCTKIAIGPEMSMMSFAKAAVSFVTRTVKQSATKKMAEGNNEHASAVGYYGHASAAGYNGHASAAGYYGHACAVGNYGYATVKGKNSIAAGFGIKSKAKGKLACWLVLAEWHQVNDEWQIKNIKTALVDGEKIKEDTWYQLKNGEFAEVNEQT